MWRSLDSWSEGSSASQSSGSWGATQSSMTAALIWLNSRPGQNVPATPLEGEFAPFDPSTYEELADVPQLHLVYLLEQREAGEPALGFVFVRHVLVAGPVDISGLSLSGL